MYENTHRSFLQKVTSPYQLNNSENVVDAIVKDLIAHSAGIVIEELERAKRKTETYAEKTRSCCQLKTAMGLPCRHLFATRIQKNEAIYSREEVCSTEEAT